MLQLEEVIGKRIADQYGEEILQAMRQHEEINPNDHHAQTGQWKNPKGKRPLDDEAAPTPKPSTRQSSSKKALSGQKSIPALFQQKEMKRVDVKVPSKSNECIDLDSDSDEGEGAPANGTKAVIQNDTEDVIEETDDEDDDFSLFKRVKR